jgi:hypothetical protein
LPKTTIDRPSIIKKEHATTIRAKRWVKAPGKKKRIALRKLYSLSNRIYIKRDLERKKQQGSKK